MQNVSSRRPRNPRLDVVVTHAQCHAGYCVSVEERGYVRGTKIRATTIWAEWHASPSERAAIAAARRWIFHRWREANRRVPRAMRLRQDQIRITLQRAGARPTATRRRKMRQETKHIHI